ncbi:D-aminoacyl-tRNA deacylase [Atopobium sp. oral taxon 810]|uniref:D-aminoacyl-tRNA deacylase n=1 Tax=Atopobium sp. oral taxon 810 TaxID=712158 RepID=UPI0003981A7E|nr:D-aminoacyl-tRNA deacylase [Atopobium sp. oral taxon 810]ERI05731.1 D-tyrosyl-tRNA(Tyr) deacylase [Atopobium sp. oral taxon 810 str. F0209]
MRALLQRVSQAECRVDGTSTGSCGLGYLILLGVGPADDEAAAKLLWEKIRKLRVFDDTAGKMNLSLEDVGGDVLVVSQFTLYANCRRGNRPSFAEAAPPAIADELYQYFCQLAETDLGPERVGRGIFAADMKVTLTNDGPVTIWLETEELTKPRRQLS